MWTRILIMIISFGCLGRVAVATPSPDRNEKLLAAGVPEIVLQLEKWPSAKVIAKKEVDVKDVTPRTIKASRWWIERVFDPVFLPESENVETYYLKKETEWRDVVRSRWMIDKYVVEVSQTYSVFVVKVDFPQNIERFEQLDLTRTLFRKMFREDGAPSTRTIMGQTHPENTAEVAIWLTLNKVDGIVLENGDYVLTAQLSSPELDNPTFYYMNWFEVLGCWNDGESLVIYFEKPRGGSRPRPRSDFRPKNDRGWFSTE